MAGDSFTLRFELTRAELREISLRRPWGTKRLFALGYALMAALSAIDQGCWLAGLFVTSAVLLWFAPRLAVWLMTRFPSLTPELVRVEILVDSKGMRVRYPLAGKISPLRYWWSRLSQIREDQFGITLLYDRNWWKLTIPWTAFEDIAHQDRFLRIARQQLFLRFQAVVTHDSFQKAS